MNCSNLGPCVWIGMLATMVCLSCSKPKNPSSGAEQIPETPVPNLPPTPPGHDGIDLELKNFQTFFSKVPSTANNQELTVIYPIDNTKIVERTFLYGLCKKNSLVTLQIQSSKIVSHLCEDGKFYFDLASAPYGSIKITLKQDPDTQNEKVLKQRLDKKNVTARFANQPLVVFNTNASHAEEIARYYVKKRGLSDKSLCPVTTITGNYAEKKDALGIRSQILKNCIKPLLPSSVDINNLEEVRLHSPISHLALVRGIPYFLTGVGWAGEQSDIPVLATYLSHMIYKDPQQVLNPANNGIEPEPLYYFPYFHMSRELNPEIDHMVAWGYIGGFDYESSKRIIDRTISAENKGINGQIVSNISPNSTQAIEKNSMNNLLLTIMNDDRVKCINYLKNNTRLIPHDCKTAASVDYIPAYTSTLEHPINASIYLGLNFRLNNHSGFNSSFNKMLGWRKSTSTCIPLCKDLPLAEQLGCKEKSLDYFKQINSDCVGVSQGFIGHQVRSYPVTFFGVMPTGWDVEAGPGPKSDPKLMLNGGYTGSNPTKTRYLRFGGQSKSVNLNCIDEHGATYSCKEKTPISLIKEDKIPGNISTETLNTIVRLNSNFRYRFPAESGTVRICLFYDFLDQFRRNLRRLSNNSNYVSSQVCRDVSSNGQWQQVDFGVSSFQNTKFPDGNQDNYVDTVRTWIRIGLTQYPVGYFDIDDFELVRTDINQRLSDDDISGFEFEDMTQLTPGDYAANILERLGGIGWWGSSSHFRTGGGAWAKSQNFISHFISGGTLGEAVYTAQGAPSGLIFADPLYHPAAIYLRIGYNNQLANISYYQDPKQEGQFYTRIKHSDLGTIEPFVVRAIHGVTSTKGFNLLKCTMLSVHDCNISNGWTSVYQHAGPVYNKQIHITSDSLGLDPTKEYRILFSLKVENSKLEVHPLYSNFEVHVLPNE